MQVNIKVDSQLRKLERLSNACDYCLDRMFNPKYEEIRQSTWWYNYFLCQIREVLKFNPYLCTDDLNISDLMKSSITTITYELRSYKPVKIRFFH
jgi:hypothetical protein